MSLSKIKRKLDRGEVVIGTQLRSGNSAIAEMMAFAGYDYVFVDNEHFPGDASTTLDLIRILQGGGTAVLLRLPEQRGAIVAQYLDAGADAILCPHVDTAREAEQLMQAAKFYPRGQRGFSNGPRAARYGYDDIREFQQRANRESWLMPMIESKAAVENLDAILKTGVDAIHIGQMDLSASYGYFGEQDHPEVQEALDTILQKANQAAVPVAIAAPTVEQAMEYIQRGAKLITFGSDMMLLKTILRQNREDLAAALRHR